MSTSESSARPPTGRMAPSTYPGERLGLPRRGVGAAAGWGRRIAAIFVDWFASLAVAALIFGPGVLTSTGWQTWMTMVVFWLEVSALTPLAGGSFGQLIARVAVLRLDNQRIRLPMSMLRTLLICVVVPPLIYNSDQRGLHDLVAGTIAVRR